MYVMDIFYIIRLMEVLLWLIGTGLLKNLWIMYRLTV